MHRFLKNSKRYIEKHPKTANLVVGCLFFAGLYLLTLTLSPAAPPKPLKIIPPVLQGKEVDPQNPTKQIVKNRIIIPKIGADYRIYTGGDWALNLGVWHRFPERGDPENGGNFILSAHRFKLDWTPTKTRKLSPFYHIDKLAVGDQILVDFNGKRYTYKVTKTYSVTPTQVEIEAPSATAHMTLYSCSLKGSADGRTVVEAVLQ